LLKCAFFIDSGRRGRCSALADELPEGRHAEKPFDNGEKN
jgi:hypothetical protein